MCGGLSWPQARFGHGARVGALAFHCDRRARVLARDIFRFGTATSVLLLVVLAGVARRGSESAGEPGPAGVDDLVLVVVGKVGEALAAVDAQPAAVVGADR